MGNVAALAASRSNLKTLKPMENKQIRMDFAQVERALDWAKRSGYVDGEAAGEAFARITGRTMSIRDGGLYPDGLEWTGPQVIAAPDLLAACLDALQSADEIGIECPGAEGLRAAIARATGNPA